jgi:hypothetical protein
MPFVWANIVEMKATRPRVILSPSKDRVDVDRRR